jgi:hypothetical protein
MPIKTVLIIDDSPTERHILSQLLLSGRLRGQYRRKR